MTDYFKSLKTLVDQSQKIVLTTHVRPDGDGLGSEASLYHYFDSIGKNVRIINISPLPRVYDFLDSPPIFETFNSEIHSHAIKTADIIILLDFNQIYRLEEMADFVSKSDGKIVVLDHHLDPGKFAHLLCINEEACSTGEMVYDFISFHSGREVLSLAESVGIYAAIITDTGSFRFPRTTANVHRKTANLLTAGVDPFFVYDRIYQQQRLSSLHLQGHFLANIKLAYDGKLAYSVISQKEFERFDADLEDTEGFVQQLISMKWVQMGILFVEQSYGYKVSFRSRGQVNVNALANKFSGGGHFNASGARLNQNGIDAIEALILEAKHYLTEEETTP